VWWPPFLFALATNKKKKYKKNEVMMGTREGEGYGTAPWCVHRFLEAVKLPGGTWFEPCVGHGLIVRAVNEVRQDVDWSYVEQDMAYLPAIKQIGGDEGCIADFLSIPITHFYNVKCVITNPPYSLAEQFVEKCQLFADNVVMLLRVNWLGSAERTKFFYKNMPDIYVLPNRPSFKKSTNANSDPTEYAWFHWSQRRSNSGKIRRLDETPVEIRSKQQAELYKIYEYYYGTG